MRSICLQLLVYIYSYNLEYYTPTAGKSYLIYFCILSITILSRHYGFSNIPIQIDFCISNAYVIYVIICYYINNLSLRLNRLFSVLIFLLIVIFQSYTFNINIDYKVWYNFAILPVCTAFLFL